MILFESVYLNDKMSTFLITDEWINSYDIQKEKYYYNIIGHNITNRYITTRTHCYKIWEIHLQPREYQRLVISHLLMTFCHLYFEHEGHNDKITRYLNISHTFDIYDIKTAFCSYFFHTRILYHRAYIDDSKTALGRRSLLFWPPHQDTMPFCLYRQGSIVLSLILQWKADSR